MTNFCRDCKHRVGKEQEGFKCALSVDKEIEEREYLVQGIRREPKLEYCVIYRMSIKPCGLEGKLFEPRETLHVA